MANHDQTFNAVLGSNGLDETVITGIDAEGGWNVHVTYTINWQIAQQDGSNTCEVQKATFYVDYSSDVKSSFLVKAQGADLFQTSNQSDQHEVRDITNYFDFQNNNSGTLTIYYQHNAKGSAKLTGRIVFDVKQLKVTKPQTIQVPTIALSDNNAIGNPQVVYITNDDSYATYDVQWRYFDENGNQIIYHNSYDNEHAHISNNSPGFAIDNTSPNYNINRVLLGNKNKKTINGIVVVDTFDQTINQQLVQPSASANCYIDIPPSMGPSFRQVHFNAEGEPDVESDEEDNENVSIEVDNENEEEEEEEGYVDRWYGRIIVERDQYAERAFVDDDVKWLQNHCTIKFPIYALQRRFAYLKSVTVSTNSGQMKSYDLPDDEEDINGAYTYEVSNTGEETEYTINPMDALKLLVDKSGKFTVTVTITDSRGFTATDQFNLEGGVTACNGPIFTSASIERCDQDGTPNEEGAYALVKATETHYASELAEFKAQLMHGQEAIGYPVDIEDNQAILGNANNPLNPEQSYTAIVTAKDSLDQSTSIVLHLGSAIYTIHRKVGGNGVAFGKASELFGIEINEEWPLYTHGKEIQRLILDLSHPIGSVLETFNDLFDPNTEWPWSVWARINDVFLYANGEKNTGSIGGNKENGVLSYTYEHGGKIRKDSSGTMRLQGDGNLIVQNDTASTGAGAVSLWSSGTYGSMGGDHYTFVFGDTPAATQENNMPPYLVVNMWVRVR